MMKQSIAFIFVLIFAFAASPVFARLHETSTAQDDSVQQIEFGHEKGNGQDDKQDEGTPGRAAGIRRGHEKGNGQDSGEGSVAIRNRNVSIIQAHLAKTSPGLGKSLGEFATAYERTKDPAALVREEASWDIIQVWLKDSLLSPVAVEKITRYFHSEAFLKADADELAATLARISNP